MNIFYTFSYSQNQEKEIDRKYDIVLYITYIDNIILLFKPGEHE